MNGRKVGRRQLGAALGDDGQRQMAVGRRASMSGDVLDHGHDAAGDEALADGLGQRDHLLDAAPVGAVADDVVGACDRHIEHRRAVGIDAELGEIGGQEARCLERRHHRRRVIARVERAVGGGGRQRAAQRRPQPLHASAFLVDQHEQIVGADGGAHVGDQRADLRVVLEIAREEDEPRRPRVLEECGFVARQLRARDTDDESGAHHLSDANFRWGRIASQGAPVERARIRLLSKR